MTETPTIESSASYRRFIGVRTGFIRLIAEGLQQCRGFCKLEDDRDVRVALKSRDPKRVSDGVNIWCENTLKRIMTLKIVDGYSSKKVNPTLITTLFLWSCISRKCERYMAYLTKLATATDNPLDGITVMEIAITLSLNNVTKLVLEWSEVDQPAIYKSWYYLLLVEQVMPSIFPLVKTSPKNNRKEAMQLTHDFRKFVMLDAAAGNQKPDLPSWPTKNVSTNAEFLEAAKQAISTSKILSKIISGFIQQQNKSQVRAKNIEKLLAESEENSFEDHPHAQYDAEASVPEKHLVEYKNVKFEDLRPAQHNAISALKNIKPKLEQFYLYLSDNFQGSVTFTILDKQAEHYIKIIEDKSKPDSLGKTHPEEVWAIGTVLRQLISKETMPSELESILIHWLELELHQKSTNSNNVNSEILSALATDLEEKQDFISALKVVNGDLSLLRHLSDPKKSGASKRKIDANNSVVANNSVQTRKRQKQHGYSPYRQNGARTPVRKNSKRKMTPTNFLSPSRLGG